MFKNLCVYAHRCSNNFEVKELLLNMLQHQKIDIKLKSIAFVQFECINDSVTWTQCCCNKNDFSVYTIALVNRGVY